MKQRKGVIVLAGAAILLSLLASGELTKTTRVESDDLQGIVGGCSTYECDEISPFSVIEICGPGCSGSYVVFVGSNGCIGDSIDPHCKQFADSPAYISKKCVDPIGSEPCEPSLPITSWGSVCAC